MKILLQQHNPEWPQKFLEIRNDIRQALEDVHIISIEHVGSTCISGLVAKPVIDIDIVIPSTSLESARKALTNAGYTDCGELNVPGRWQFRQPGYGRSEAAHGLGRNGEVRHNTYVLVEDSLALRNHLDVRRVLLEDATLREEYNAVKLSLKQREFGSIGEYVAGKTEILCKILLRAGWTDEDLKVVIAANSPPTFGS